MDGWMDGGKSSINATYIMRSRYQRGMARCGERERMIEHTNTMIGHQDSEKYPFVFRPLRSKGSEGEANGEGSIH